MGLLLTLIVLACSTVLITFGMFLGALLQPSTHGCVALGLAALAMALIVEGVVRLSKRRALERFTHAG